MTNEEKEEAIEIMAEAEWMDCHGIMGGRQKKDCLSEARIMLSALCEKFTITRQSI